MSYRAIEKLRGGKEVTVRAIRPDDQARLNAHFHGLSGESIYFRFMGAHRELTPSELEHLTRCDFDTHVGLAATLGEGGDERFIGIGRYYRDAGSNSGEVAFAVLDDFQGQGVATVLLEHLRRIAVAGGLTEFTATALADNRKMLEVFTQSGFPHRVKFDGGVVQVAMKIDAHPEAHFASDRKEGKT